MQKSEAFVMIAARNCVRKLSATAVNVKPSVTKLIIDGKQVNAVSGKTFATIDPRTEKEICKIAEAGPEDVELAVASARKAFDEGAWPRMTGWSCFMKFFV